MKNRRRSIAASAIVRHVLNGDWLGSIWWRYVQGLPRHINLDQAMVLAEQRYHRRTGRWLWTDSERNFKECSHG